jgi:hypothetical protein
VSVKVESISNVSMDAEEAEFRERYSRELRGKKQRVYLGHNELEEERKQVNQQAMKTPGRRGEIIKNEEIDREISRRYREHKKSNLIS